MKLSTVLATIRTYKQPWIYYGMYLNLIKRDSILELRNGLKFYSRYDKGDHLSISENFVVNQYADAINKLKKNDVVVEIGGHIGTFGLTAGLKGAKVYSYEPDKENFKTFKKNIKLNNSKNIHVMNKAIAKRSGTKTFYLSSKHGSGHSLFQLKSANVERDKVKASSLRSEVQINKIKSINLLKLDCEGAEYEVLLNLPNQITQLIENIILEFHISSAIQYSDKDLIDWLYQNKFKILKHEKTKATAGLIYATKEK